MKKTINFILDFIAWTFILGCAIGLVVGLINATVSNDPNDKTFALGASVLLGTAWSFTRITNAGK